MKRILLTGLCAALISGFAFAQDINEAIELYNTALKDYQDKNYELAIQSIEQAHSIALSIQDSEEAATVKENCEAVIPAFYLSYGNDFVAKKNNDEALATLKKAIEQAEKYSNTEVKGDAEKLIPQIYLSAGTVDFNAKNYPAAIANYKKALEYEPGNSTAQLRIGLAYLQAKDEANAVAALVAAKELADEAGSANDAATASKQLGRLYFVRAVEVQKAKKWKEVLADAKRSVEYDGTNAQAQKLMGIAGVELKDWDTAIAGLEAALTADPNAKDKNNTIYRLAVSYEAKKNTAKACEYYKQLLGDANYKATADHKIKNELKCN